MTRWNYIFGFWGLVNVAAFVAFLWANHCDSVPRIESPWIIVLFVAMVLIPFGQAARRCDRLHLEHR